MNTAAITAPVEVSKSRFSAVVTGVALAALFGAVYWKVVMDLVRDWWTNPDYSHGLLLPFIIAYLWRRDATHARRCSPTWYGLTALVGAQLIMLVGYAGAEFFLQRISLLFSLAAIVLLLYGWARLRDVLFLLIVSMLAIPLPTIIFNAVALPLQLFASSVAEHALGLLSIPVLREGNVLYLSQQTLNVAEACSGIRSLMTLLTATVLVAHLAPLQRWAKVLLAASAIPLAIIANALRVAGTGVLAQYFGERAAQGFFHTFSGWLVFVVALGLLMFETTLMQRFGGRKEEAQ